MSETAANLPLTIAERVKELLGQGLSSSVVASSVGCEPSYISQLMEDDEFKNAVAVLRAGKAQGAVRRDNKWDAIEDAALERAGELVHLVTRPTDLVRLAAMANAAKRRSTEFSGGSENASATVTIVLPKAASIHFQMNSQAQVVEVDGESMAPLPARNLQLALKERTLARETAGIVDVHAPTAVERTERKKVVSILEQIGYADEPVPVQKVLP